MRGTRPRRAELYAARSLPGESSYPAFVHDTDGSTIEALGEEPQERYFRAASNASWSVSSSVDAVAPRSFRPEFVIA